jgi:hypothetical protein
MPQRAFIMGLTCPTRPQDKEGFGSFTSHEEHVNFIFEESVPFCSNHYMFVSLIQKKDQTTSH